MDVSYGLCLVGSTIYMFCSTCRPRVPIVEHEKAHMFVFGHNGFNMFLGCTWDVLGMYVEQT